MQDSSVEEIKSKLNIEEVVGQYLQLSRAGRNLKACCPFHNEKTPSFIVSPERQSWHCFGCGEGGDIFSFVMKMDGVEFVDALKTLADKAGVQLKKMDYKDKGEKGNILEVVEAAKKFYRGCLKIKSGVKAYEYLRGRGISDEMIEVFELGYAPDSWSLLSEYLQKKGFKEKDIFAAGMTVQKDKGGFYDRFRGRIMFPIDNIAGQTAGFSSRIMPGGDESSAKYINTPETLVYNKGRILYGLDKSKIFIRQKDQCVMVEGNVDVIASFQAGVNNVVATSGTALTVDQLRIIKRYTNNIVFSFDMDSAGVKAASRGIEMALAEGMNVSVIRVPEGKDPADCVKSDPQVWVEAAANPIKVMDFYFESALDENNDWRDVENKKNIAKNLLRIISIISNNIERSYYLNKLSFAIGEIGISEKDLWGTMLAVEKEQKPARNNDAYQSNKASVAKPDREYKLQEKLLGFVAVDLSNFGAKFEGLDELFENKDFLDIYKEIEDCYKSRKSLLKEDLEQIKQKLEDKDSSHVGSQNLASVLDTAIFSVESHSDEDEFDIVSEAEKCIVNLREIILRRKIKKIEMEIKSADTSNNAELLEKLSKEYMRLLGEIDRTDF
ncbi:MAG: DNA primase [Candidatus Pacebacteria bacterium]|nr:DNA primase [Candidatus Paceibacterota bacterium]